MKQDKMLFAGSFNPYTIGHHSVYETASEILNKDAIILGIAQNPNKPGTNPQLLKWIVNPAFPYFMSTNVKVVNEPVVADYAITNKYKALIRSLRNSIDLVHESDLATWNKELGVDTVYVPSAKELDHVSSSAIRELDSLGKDMSKYFINDIQYKRYKAKRPERVIVVGRMGSGKSSYIKDTFETYHCVDMDQLVKDNLKKKHREAFKTFFGDHHVSEISMEWKRNEDIKNAKAEVVEIIENEFNAPRPSRLMPIYEVSAFTAYPELHKYIEDSIIVYVDQYDNGKEREIDVDFMVKALQLQEIPKVVDFVVSQDNGKVKDVTINLKDLIISAQLTK